MKRLLKYFVIVILLFWTAIYLPSCKKEATPPVVTTTNISDITKTTASIGGTVSDDGGAEITDFGVCWSTSLNPTTSSNKAINISGSNTFIGSITGLTANTRYYARAYATNSAGTSYGQQISFLTIQFNEGSTVPTLITIEVTSITSISAVSGGNITNDGGEEIIDKGIMWNTVPEWYIYDDGVSIYRYGPGSGSFVNNLSGLTPGTTYYVKAFAVNGVGTAFGPTLRFTTSISQGNSSWTQKTGFPGGARYSSASFSIGTKVYIGIGYNDGDMPTRDFWEWDQTTKVWTRKADYPGNTTGIAVSFSIGTKGYIGTGNDFKTIGFTNEFWEYDPGTDRWTQKASLPTIPGRALAVGFSIGTKGYIGLGNKDLFTTGGNPNPSYYQDFWEWDQTANEWTKKADFPGNTRSGAVGFSIGNKGYIGTGGDGTNYSKDFWEWDQSTNVWTKKADFEGIGRSEAVGFSIGNKGYIGTGYSSGTTLNILIDFWEWDQETNIWTEKANFGGIARSSAVGFSIGNKGYIGTGANGPGIIYASQDFWEYDPTQQE
jgi:N-acetylneuraminic acid mutarotase